MTRRSGEWHLVGYDRDPVPADWSDVNDVARDYRNRADALSLAYETLTNLSELNGWTGEASVKFLESADDGLGDIAKARDKYDGAADALVAFATKVSSARTDTAQGLQEAEDAEAIRVANDVDGLAGVDEPTDAQQDAQDDRDQAATDAGAALNAAATKVQNAVAALEEEARLAADKINEASESFDDGWFDDFKGWVRDNVGVFKFILKILEIAAIALAVLAIVFGGWVIFLIAIAVAVAIVAINAMLYAAGEATLGDVIMSIVGLALTFVGGKLAIKLAQGMKGALKGAMQVATTTVRANARAGGGPLAQFLLRRSMVNPLRWLGEGAAGIRGITAVRALRSTLDELTTPIGSAVRLADRGSAAALRQLDALADMGFDVARFTDDAAGLAARMRQNGYLTYGIIGDGTLQKVTDIFGDPTSPFTLLADGIDEIQQNLAEFHWRLTSTG